MSFRACPASCCLVGHLASTCPLVLHFEQYGSSGQSLFRCPGCLQGKQSCSSCPLDFSCCLLRFTPSPLVDFGMLHCGEPSTFWGATAAGMKGLADGLICDPLEGVVSGGLGCGSTCWGGNGVGGKGYIPGLLSHLSIKSISLVICSITAVVLYNSGNSRTSS